MLARLTGYSPVRLGKEGQAHRIKLGGLTTFKHWPGRLHCRMSRPLYPPGASEKTSRKPEKVGIPPKIQ